MGCDGFLTSVSKQIRGAGSGSKTLSFPEEAWGLKVSWGERKVKGERGKNQGVSSALRRLKGAGML